MNLYEISARYQQLLDQDEYTAEELQELEALHGSLEEQCISRGKYIRNLEAERTAVFNAIREMTDRLADLADREEKQKEKLARIMLENNMPHITSSPLFPLRAKQNPVSVSVIDQTFIPENYWTETIPKPIKRIDKVAIKAAIESGIEVPGVMLTRTLKLEFK